MSTVNPFDLILISVKRRDSIGPKTVLFHPHRSKFRRGTPRVKPRVTPLVSDASALSVAEGAGDALAEKLKKWDDR
jgi:hypothetical protein